MMMSNQWVKNKFIVHKKANKLVEITLHVCFFSFMLFREGVKIFYLDD
jgi:hypothetical protein